jgi:hypothetical protein
MRAIRCEFAFQCISDLLDLGDGRLYDIQLFNHGLAETLTELSELIFIETICSDWVSYCSALLCVGWKSRLHNACLAHPEVTKPHHD